LSANARGRASLRSVLFAYLVALAGGVAGNVVHFLWDVRFARLPPYTCYVWDANDCKALAAYLLVAPLVAAIAWPRARRALVVLGLVAAVLGLFASSFTLTEGCAPL
jgi:hypothetical protein